MKDYRKYIIELIVILKLYLIIFAVFFYNLEHIMKIPYAIPIFSILICCSCYLMGVYWSIILKKMNEIRLKSFPDFGKK